MIADSMYWIPDWYTNENTVFQIFDEYLFRNFAFQKVHDTVIDSKLFTSTLVKL